MAVDATLTAFVAFVVALDLVSVFKARGVPLLGLVLGSLSFSMGVATLGNETLPLQPWASMLLLSFAALTIAAAAFDLNPSRKKRRY